MPRVISIPHSPKLPELREGVYLSQAKVQESVRAKNALDQARNWAKNQVKEVETELKLLRTNAFKAGYRDGIIAAAQEVAAHFDEEHRLAHKVQEKLEQDAQNMLKNALNHPDIVLSLLDEWVGQQVHVTNLALKLTVPLSSNLTRSVISARLDSSWQQRLQIEYHNHSYFILQYGDEIAEFRPDNFIEETKQSLLRNIDNVYGLCATLDKVTLEKLQLCFAKKFKLEAQDNTQSDLTEDFEEK